MQLGGFFALAVAGILAGFVYELGNIIKIMSKNHICIVILVDFLAAIAFGAFFFFAELKYLGFKISLFGVLVFIVGIVVERTSLGFLLAKQTNKIYNVLKDLGKWFKNTKLGKKTLK